MRYGELKRKLRKAGCYKVKDEKLSKVLNVELSEICEQETEYDE